MTKIAVWCRHAEDDIIGIGPNIPWKILSDFKRFRRLTKNKTLVAGQTTYETFPNRTLPDRKICVLTFDPDYEVSDPTQHRVVTDISFFKDFEDELYISGGASIYKAFMTGGSKLMPDIIVDCMYHGPINPALQGTPVSIRPCIEIMNRDYIKISADYELDDVLTTVWVRKNTFIDQTALKHIITAIEADGE